MSQAALTLMSILQETHNYWSLNIFRIFNTFCAGVRYTRTLKSCIEHVCLHYSPVTLQLRNLPGDCARELFKHSKDVASLRVCSAKKFFGFGFQVFYEWNQKWGRFLAVFAQVTWPWAQPQEGSISLKFLLEARLESKSLSQLSSISGSKVIT